VRAATTAAHHAERPPQAAACRPEQHRDGEGGGHGGIALHALLQPAAVDPDAVVGQALALLLAARRDRA